jgi:hypothetical protein
MHAATFHFLLEEYSHPNGAPELTVSIIKSVTTSNGKKVRSLPLMNWMAMER